jgi:hypothetical protein
VTYPIPPSPAKYQCAPQLRGPGRDILCLSLSYFSMLNAPPLSTIFPLFFFRVGASPLWIAAQMGQEDIVKLLLKAGAKVGNGGTL